MIVTGEEPKYWDKRTYGNAILSTTNPTWTGKGQNVVLTVRVHGLPYGAHDTEY